MGLLIRGRGGETIDAIAVLDTLRDLNFNPLPRSDVNYTRLVGIVAERFYDKPVTAVDIGGAVDDELRSRGYISMPAELLRRYIETLQATGILHVGPDGRYSLLPCVLKNNVLLQKPEWKLTAPDSEAV